VRNEGDRVQSAPRKKKKGYLLNSIKKGGKRDVCTWKKKKKKELETDPKASAKEREGNKGHCLWRGGGGKKGGERSFRFGKKGYFKL